MPPPTASVSKRYTCAPEVTGTGSDVANPVLLKNIGIHPLEYRGQDEIFFVSDLDVLFFG
jgi:hypothetical protein